MGLVQSLILTAVLFLSATQASAAPIGAVRLCRDQELIEPAQKELNNADIRLPTNLLLDDFGPVDDPHWYDHRWPLTIITLKPVEMPPRVKCIVVPAIISPLSKIQTVAPSDRRNFGVVGVTAGDGNDDPTAPPIPEGFENLHATVVQEFK
jgi:hypothetical protein